MSVSEAGRLGGNKRRETADYAAMGRRGGEVTKQRHGMANYAAAGEDPYGLDHPPLLGLLEDQLDAAAQQITGNPNINAVGYNEHLGRTREEVLALFDRALVEVTK